MTKQEPFTSGELKLFLACCFTFGSVFTAAHGLFAVSAGALAAAVLFGFLALLELTRPRSSRSVFYPGVIAMTFTVLAVSFAWTGASPLPFAVVLALAVVPVLAWLVLLLLSRRPGARQARTTSSH